MADPDVYKRMFERERAARKAAEDLLESKSLELWDANEKVRKSAATLESIFVSASDGILMFSEAGLVETSNPAAQLIFGYSENELIGKHVSTLMPNTIARKEMEETQFWSQACTIDHPHITTHGVKANGDLFDMELSASRGKRAHLEDEVVFIWVMRNTQRINELEQQVIVDQRLKAIGQLAAGVSHEINTPIQFVHENTKFLQEAFESMEKLLMAYEEVLSNVESDIEPCVNAKLEASRNEHDTDFYREEVPRAIQETISGSQRVSSIVVAIKEFSHPGSDEKLPFDINRAIESTITMSAHHWKHIANIELQLDPELPEVACFGSDINQVLLNLIVNASDAISERAEAEGIHGQITIATKVDGDEILIRFSDTGAGINKQDIDQIFTPFFTTKDVGKGTGQGLSLVHRVIVDRHGGSIAVESECGVGTTFFIRLPIESVLTPVDV